jgi:tRNA(Ile2) C34 agmatinyltransferase TiaS
MGIGDRVYNCEDCGNIMERDYNSAVDIEVEGMKTVPTERRDHLVKPAENTADTAEVMELLQKIHHVSCKLCSVKQEAHEFIRG